MAEIITGILTGNN